MDVHLGALTDSASAFASRHYLAKQPLLPKLRAIIFLTYFTIAERCRNVLSPTKFTMHPRENIFTGSYNCERTK